MVSRDLNYIVAQLEKRIKRLESHIFIMANKDAIEDQDWDNATLLREWKISKRTAANYRKAGLVFYKRGGRIYHTAESRANFINQQIMKIDEGKK